MKKLHVLWTTGDKEVAMRMIFVYLLDSKSMGWWDEINVVIWGPSARLLAEDPEVQAELDMVIQSGIIVEACRGCTEAYGVTKIIRSLGIEVKYMGESLTRFLHGEGKVITF
jgi:hypothetical protein